MDEAKLVAAIKIAMRQYELERHAEFYHQLAPQVPWSSLGTEERMERVAAELKRRADVNYQRWQNLWCLV